MFQETGVMGKHLARQIPLYNKLLWITISVERIMKLQQTNKIWSGDWFEVQKMVIYKSGDNTTIISG